MAANVNGTACLVGRSLRAAECLARLGLSRLYARMPVRVVRVGFSRCCLTARASAGIRESGASNITLPPAAQSLINVRQTAGRTGSDRTGHPTENAESPRTTLGAPRSTELANRRPL